jgi:hypothetical protein
LIKGLNLSTKHKKTFKELKKAFIKTSILLYFNFKRRIRLKIDVFDFAISEILFQLMENQINDILSRSFLEKCSQRSEIMKLKKAKCSQ